MKTIKLVAILTFLLYFQNGKAQEYFNLNSTYTGVQAKMKVFDVDPAGSQLYHLIINNYTNSELKIILSYQVIDKCGGFFNGTKTVTLGPNKQTDDGGYTGSRQTKPCVKSGNSIQSVVLTNLKVEDLTEQKRLEQERKDKEKFEKEQQEIKKREEKERLKKIEQERIEQENKELEEQKIIEENNKVREREEAERKELEEKIQQAENEEAKRILEEEAEKIESDRKEKLLKEKTEKKNKEEKKENTEKENTIDYKANEKYSLQLAVNTILTTENNNTYNYNKGDIMISGFKYYDYIDMVIKWCDNYQAQWGYDSEVANYKKAISNYSRSMVIANGVNEVFEASTKLELVGGLGLQPTSLITENPNTLYETYNLELRFHFIPGWFKLVAGVGIGVMDFPDLSFSAYDDNQPAFTDITKLSIDSEIKYFRILAGFHQSITLNEDKTIHLSFEQLGKLNFLSTNEKYASSGQIEFPLGTPLIDNTDYLLDDIFSLTGGIGFDFGFGGSFGIGIYGNASYYFYGDKEHIGTFTQKSNSGNYDLNYDYVIKEPKIKQFIPSLSLKLFLDFQ